jgi:hypothetical protein
VALLAPALPWLMAPGALADVRARVYARAGALDELAPPYVIERIVRGLPARAPLDYQVVPGWRPLRLPVAVPAGAGPAARLRAGARSAGLRSRRLPGPSSPPS